MKLVNLTPAEIVLRGPDGKDIHLMPSGNVARAATVEEVVGELAGYPVVAIKPGKAEGVPDPEPGTVYLVAHYLVHQLGRLRPDVFCAARPVRDDEGRVVAATALARMP